MAEEIGPVSSEEITDQDKLMAALSYPIPLVSIIILLVEEMKERSFQKYHAVQSLVINVVLWVIVAIFSCVLGSVVGALTAGIGAICGFLPFLLWFVTLYWAYQAYQGQWIEIPVVTDFCKEQDWI